MLLLQRNTTTHNDRGIVIFIHKAGHETVVEPLSENKAN